MAAEVIYPPMTPACISVWARPTRLTGSRSVGPPDKRLFGPTCPPTRFSKSLSDSLGALFADAPFKHPLSKELPMRNKPIIIKSSDLYSRMLERQKPNHIEQL